MSWMQKLYETYDNCASEVGIEHKGQPSVLLPICHTTQQAQVEIILDAYGNFKDAKVIEKGKGTTIIPCREKSSIRSGSAIQPHPLSDKLQYIAKDLPKYTDTDKLNEKARKKFETKCADSFSAFQKILSDWCASSFSHPKAQVVLSYIQKGTLVQDLVSHQILHLGENGKLLAKWEDLEEEKPAIFTQTSINQEGVFIRWQVEKGDESRAWKDQSLWDSWRNYYLSTDEQKEGFCFVTGKVTRLARKHLGKIRNAGDSAKIISSNDLNNFTFLGRFTLDIDDEKNKLPNQAAAVSYEVSQKAHLALRWLIARQGYRKDSLAIVAWSTTDTPIPDPLEDSFDFLLIGHKLDDDDTPPADTDEGFAIRLKNAIAGYGKKITPTDQVVAMAVDSASPGRLSIIYYRVLLGSDFLRRVEFWHSSCLWKHRYRKIEKVDELTRKKSRITKSFIGAPAPYDIIETAYGMNADENLMKLSFKRLLPCIIDGKPLPGDIVQSAIRRISNRIALEEWEWEKGLTITCALYKKFNQKENYQMTLETDRHSRDYLYGRLLAVAENIEQWALSEANESRPTNALRLMQKFAERPYSTWRTLELALTPYKVRLGSKLISRQKQLDDIMSSFSPEDFTNDRPLSGEYLLGYHCQREALYKKNDKKNDSE